MAFTIGFGSRMKYNIVIKPTIIPNKLKLIMCLLKILQFIIDLVFAPNSIIIGRD